MIYNINNETYDLEKLKQYVFCVLGNEIGNNIINMYKSNDEQNHLTKYIKEFKTKTKPQNNSNLKKVKEDVINMQWHFLKEEKWCLRHFKVEYFKEYRHKYKININILKE